MKRYVYLFAVCLFAYIRSGTSESFETVWLKDVTTRFQTDKRTLIDLDLPNDLTFHLTRGSEILTLNLKRNHNINPHADVYFEQKLKDGRSVLVKSRNYEKEDVAYYQDRENWAYMTVRCLKISNEPCERIINGNLRIGDRSYDVQPVEIDVTSRNFVEIPGSLGKQYVLKDQIHTQRGYSVPKKDKSRQLQSVYHVKVAVLIDSSAWKFYLSTVNKWNPLTRNRDTKTKIQQIYSHIFNGVHLLYQGIEDPEISINVILAKFIFFKSYSEFPYNMSRVECFNKTKYIDAHNYLRDLAKWDRRIGARIQPLYDHGMLFSKYSFYLGSLEDCIRDDRYLVGLSFRGHVCDIGQRISVIMIQDLSLMVLSATHELGHSLGACHDGHEDAVDCSADDLYIMSALRDEPDPRRPYSRNPWLFSNCSVRAFKQTLMNKDCVKTLGDYYNYQEYTEHVKTQFGEVFTANEQCEFYHGKRSVVCETHIEYICHFMRCTYPKTGICGTKYYLAARGTECGPRGDHAAKYKYENENVAVLPRWIICI